MNLADYLRNPQNALLSGGNPSGLDTALSWTRDLPMVPEQRGWTPGRIPAHVSGTNPGTTLWNEDGGVAWSPVEAFKRLLQAGADERNGMPTNDRENAADAFDVAGLAAMGGFAAPKPANSIGTFGGKLAKTADLPMDQASRLARAREMGFNPDQTFYHGTQADFDAFRPSEGNELVVFDPSNIRSVNAAFDPAKSSSANLLAANPRESAAVPLATAAGHDAQNPLMQSALDAVRKYNPYRGYTDSWWALPLAASAASYGLLRDQDQNLPRAIGRQATKVATFGFGEDAYDGIFGAPTFAQEVESKYGLEPPALTQAWETRAALGRGRGAPTLKERSGQREAMPLWLQRIDDLAQYGRDK